MSGAVTNGRAVAFERDEIERNLCARLERVAALLPDRIALSGNGQRYSYEQLNRRTNQVAQAILERTRPGVGNVAYLVDHSPNMVICALASLKAGKAFLCIHPSLPAAAQREIVRDAVPDLVLTTLQLESRAREIVADPGRVVTLEAIDEIHADDPRVPIAPHDPAVIFYTSGSTGRPKGVVKSHRALLHRAWLSAQYDALGPADRQSLLTYCSFSTTESDVFGALLNGATLCLFDVGSRGLADFGAWLDEEQITVLHPPVLLFRRFLSTLNGTELFPSVRLVALAGETVVPSDLERWRRLFARSCALRHRFSTTEAGHVAVGCVEPHTDVTPGVVPAGHAVRDKQLLIVDGHGKPVRNGDSGELLVRSAYLADGYWRRPDETAAEFTPDPDAPGQRIYRTGDLGRLRPDGAFEFLGRRDNQVKIRGYRVETQEVEEALMKLDGVREAAVIPTSPQGETELVASIVNEPGSAFDPATLRERLQSSLPAWKIPARFQSIAALPLTLTGKVDRPRLLSQFSPATEPQRPTDAALASVQDELAEIVKTLLRIGSADQDVSFLNLGGNSLSAMLLANRIEERFGVRIGLEQILRNGTIRHLAEGIRTQVASH